MIRKPTRAIRTLIIGLALAGCGAGSPPSSQPAASPATPRPTNQPAGQAAPPSPEPTATLRAPAAPPSLPTQAAPPSPPAAEPAAPDAGSAGAAWPEPTATPAFPEQQITAANVGQVELLRTVGVGQALDAAFSPDQRVLAVATSGGVAWYALPELRHLRFDPITGGMNYVRFIDSQTIEVIALTDFGDDRVELRRAADGSVIESRSVQDAAPDWVPDVESPAGDLLARLPLPDSVPVYGVTIVRQSDGATLYEDRETRQLDFAADGATVAVVTAGGIVRIVDLLSDRRTQVSLPGYAAAAFSPDGQQLVTAGRELTFWDVVSGAPVQREPFAFESAFGLRGTTQSIFYSPDGGELTVDGSYAYFESEVRTASTWKIGPGGAEFAGDTRIAGRSVINHSSYVGAISPAGRAGAATSDGTTLEIHRDGALLHTLAWAEPIAGLAFSPDGATLAVSDQQGGVGLVAVEDGSAGARLSAVKGFVRLAFSPDGATLAVGGAQGGAKLIAVSDGSVRQTGGGATVDRFGFSPDGRLLAVGAEDGTVTVINVATGQASASVPSASAGARLIFSADNSLLLESDGDQVRIYGVGEGRLLRTLPAAGDDIAIGPNRRMLLVLRDGYVQLWGIR